MQIGLIGLGRMGMNMARRLIQGGHEVVAYNRTRDRVDEIVKEGAKGAYSLEELVKVLTPRQASGMPSKGGCPICDEDWRPGFNGPHPYPLTLYYSIGFIFIKGRRD